MHLLARDSATSSFPALIFENALHVSIRDNPHPRY
jgi:hypothetical protein